MSVCKNGLTVRHKLLELDGQNSSFFESEDYKKSTIGDIGISAKDINNINVPSGQLRVVNLVKRRRKKRKMCSLKLGRISYLGVPCGIHL